jgi:hypothetical protein
MKGGLRQMIGDSRELVRLLVPKRATGVHQEEFKSPPPFLRQEQACAFFCHSRTL